MFILFFQLLLNVVTKYSIKPENIWNFDEKGFIMGYCSSVKRIMTLEAYKSGRVTKAKQDGSREFVSCLACVSALGKWIPPLLIYRGDSKELQNTWVQDVKPGDKCYFSISENGWSSIAMGMKWLQEVFEKHTKPSSPREHRLLLLDGHSSHVNMAFIRWADTHRIILLVLPPHTTHRLQPLDVGLFQPLATYYSQEVDKLMTKGLGYVQMSKRFFYGFFKRAWETAFTEDNIIHAFAKPGIWPIDKEVILAKIRKPVPLLKTPIAMERTPLTTKAIRKFIVRFQKSPSKERAERASKALQILAAERSIVIHENHGLREALILEQKKRKKGKKLNLCGEEDTGAMCWEADVVIKAVEFQAEKERLQQLEDEAKEQRKIQRAANALIKREEQIAKEQRQAAKQLAKDLVAANPVPPKTPKSRFLPAKSNAPKAKGRPRAKPKAKQPASKPSLIVKLPLGDLCRTPAVIGEDAWLSRESRGGRKIKMP
ncbi:DDE-domain-containing protein, partial [Cadophora sp. DSE1049]